LGVNVEEVVAEGPGFTHQAWEALAELRDTLAEKEKIGWWVVYNGDPERRTDGSEEDDEDGEEEDGVDGKLEETPTNFPARKGPTITKKMSDEDEEGRPMVPPKPRMAPRQAMAMAPAMTGMRVGNLPPMGGGNTPPIPSTKVPIREANAHGVLDQRKHELPPVPEKPAAEEAQKAKPASKSEGLKKKFFGKKG